jgi:hypothetical protein
VGGLEPAPYVAGVRFLLYTSHGLVDAGLPSWSALCERLRLMARQPVGVSGVYVLVFDAETDRYLGRRDIVLFEAEPDRYLGRREIVVDDGELVLVSPAVNS